MNTFTLPATLTPSELPNQIIEFATIVEAAAPAPRGMPMENTWQRNPLKGYDALMRRHAAACEAGR
jgi:hypothetical protein